MYNIKETNEQKCRISCIISIHYASWGMIETRKVKMRYEAIVGSSIQLGAMKKKFERIKLT